MVLPLPFFNEKNSGIASDLVFVLEEAAQDVEGWLADMSNRFSNRGTRPRPSGRGGRKGGGGGGGGGYQPNIHRGFNSYGGDGGNYSGGSRGSFW